MKKRKAKRQKRNFFTLPFISGGGGLDGDWWTTISNDFLTKICWNSATLLSLVLTKLARSVSYFRMSQLEFTLEEYKEGVRFQFDLRRNLNDAPSWWPNAVRNALRAFSFFFFLFLFLVVCCWRHCSLNGTTYFIASAVTQFIMTQEKTVLPFSLPSAAVII